jgi:type II secretory pathway pseudopilin PulG
MMGFALTKLGRATFTLVEIMIVVAVIVVLAAMTIPGILRTGKHRKSTEILNGLRYAEGKRCDEKTGCARFT